MIRENPDKEYANKIKKALYENNGYCPCRIIKDESTKCMCVEFQQQKTGLCHCGLYEKI